MTANILHTRSKEARGRSRAIGCIKISRDPYLKVQLSVNATATYCVVISRIGTICVRLQKRFEITRMKTYTRLIFGRGPKISAGTDSKGLVAGNIGTERAFLMRRDSFFRRTSAFPNCRIEICIHVQPKYGSAEG